MLLSAHKLAYLIFKSALLCSAVEWLLGSYPIYRVISCYFNMFIWFYYLFILRLGCMYTKLASWWERPWTCDLLPLLSKGVLGYRHALLGLFYVVLGNELGASWMLGEHSTNCIPLGAISQVHNLLFLYIYIHVYIYPYMPHMIYKYNLYVYKLYLYITCGIDR